jgi:hypothetical protein
MADGRNKGVAAPRASKLVQKKVFGGICRENFGLGAPVPGING